jgi:hypothetical protein
LVKPPVSNKGFFLFIGTDIFIDMEEGKRRRGRPKYTTMEALVHRGKVPSTWKEDILDLGRRGKNKIHYANHLGISRDLMYRIMERDADFSGTIKQALQYAEAWFISKAEEAWEENTGKNVNTTFMKYYLQNCYRDSGWVDRTDITTDNKPITPDNQIEIQIIKPKDEDTSNGTLLKD